MAPANMQNLHLFLLWVELDAVFDAPSVYTSLACRELLQNRGIRHGAVEDLVTAQVVGKLRLAEIVLGGGDGNICEMDIPQRWAQDGALVHLVRDALRGRL